MLFSKTCITGIKACIFLACQAREAGGISVMEISKEIHENEHTTSKALQLLAKQNLVTSKTGPRGGFFLTNEQCAIQLINIIHALDKDKLETECILGLSNCSEHLPCPMHKSFAPKRKALLQNFTTLTLNECRNDIDAQKAFLNN